MLPAFHWDIADWQTVAVQTEARPIHLVNIFYRETTHLVFCDDLGLGEGGMWLYPDRSSHNLVWHQPWPPEIISDLVLLKYFEGNITNSDLELATLVLHEATLLATVPIVRMTTPRSGSDNAPGILWSTRKSSMINPVVADLL